MKEYVLERFKTGQWSRILNINYSFSIIKNEDATLGTSRRQITENPKLADDQLSFKMVAQIDKYGDKLFADPIVVNTPNGSVTIYPQRTNNIIEQFTRDLKRSHRRRTGNNSMSRVLNSMLADTPLVKNLDNPEYMDMLLDGKANFEEPLSEVDSMQTEKNEN